MEWIDSVIIGLIETCSSDDPYDICNFLDIEIVKVPRSSAILAGNESLYIRNYFNNEVIFISEELLCGEEVFYLRHELGHAILHPDLLNTGSNTLTNFGKLELQANYFAYKLSSINFDEVELKNLTINQIAAKTKIPIMLLKLKMRHEA
mgnify:FL=1